MKLMVRLGIKPVMSRALTPELPNQARLYWFFFAFLTAFHLKVKVVIKLRFRGSSNVTKLLTVEHWAAAYKKVTPSEKRNSSDHSIFTFKLASSFISRACQHPQFEKLGMSWSKLSPSWNWLVLNPISAGVSDQRLLPGGVFRTPKLFSANFDLFLDLWNNCWPIFS